MHVDILSATNRLFSFFFFGGCVFLFGLFITETVFVLCVIGQNNVNCYQWICVYLCIYIFRFYFQFSLLVVLFLFFFFVSEKCEKVCYVLLSLAELAEKLIC